MTGQALMAKAIQAEDPPGSESRGVVARPTPAVRDPSPCTGRADERGSMATWNVPGRYYTPILATGPETGDTYVISAGVTQTDEAQALAVAEKIRTLLVHEMPGSMVTMTVAHVRGYSVDV